MHEFSLAQALLDQAEAHAPRGSAIRAVTVRVGPLQMVDPEAWATAWTAVTCGTRADGSALISEWPPPSRLCPACGRRWTGGEFIEPCVCGHPSPRWIDGDALVLLSLQAEFPDDEPRPIPPSPQPPTERKEP